MRNRDQVGAEWARAMRLGDFERAWRQTDLLERARRQAERKGTFSWSPDYLLWDGQPLEDRRVVVRCNHGLGDTLQFLRFVPWLRERARSVTVLAQPELVGLLGSHDQFGQVCDGWNCPSLPAHDGSIEIMELAYAFRVTEATLPRKVPYLFPQAPGELQRQLLGALGRRGRGGVERRNSLGRDTPGARREHRAPNLGGEPLRVGLHWAASQWDPSRSIPLDALQCLGGVRGVRFFSLQQGAQGGEWRKQPYPIEPLAHLTRGIREAAIALLELDLVITVDSMLAHLAGALGRPVWLMLKHDADWRWMQRRSDSPWYPSMRLFRQGRPGDWAGVAREVMEELFAYSSHSSHASHCSQWEGWEAWE